MLHPVGLARASPVSRAPLAPAAAAAATSWSSSGQLQSYSCAQLLWLAASSAPRVSSVVPGCGVLEARSPHAHARSRAVRGGECADSRRALGHVIRYLCAYMPGSQAQTCVRALPCRRRALPSVQALQGSTRRCPQSAAWTMARTVA